MRKRSKPDGDAARGNMVSVRLPNTCADLQQLVHETAHRLQKNRLQAGVALVACGTVGWLTLAAAGDLLLSMSVMMRLAAAAVFWCITLGSIALFIARPLFRPPGITVVASLIEQGIGNMHNRLITVLDVMRRGATAEHPDMFRRLVHQTCNRLSDYRTDRVARPAVARNSSIGAGLIILMCGLLFGLFSDRMPAAFARILRPTALIPPPSWIRVHSLPGNTEILEGEPLLISATVQRGTPDQVLLRVRNGSRWMTYAMSRDKKDFTFEITAVMQSFDYQVLAGRSWTPEYRVTMLERPVVREIEAQVFLPDYMALPEPRPVDFQARQVTAPSGSVLHVSAQVDGDAVRGVIQE
ncbi:MAG: hypothetical protein HQ559_08735, partial [Lentisphaerae bacterium]|nr:hypothetical protein [Lentisphaerota bacterium]